MTGLDTYPDGIAKSANTWQLPQWVGRLGVIALVALGPILAVLTVFVLGGKQEGLAGYSYGLRAILLVDLVYIIVLLALIGVRIGNAIIARRRGSAGSKLHLRLTGVFAIVALVPTVIVAIFATISVNFGMETWFSERIGSVVRNSLETAQAYEREHRQRIHGDVVAMATDLNRAAAQGITLSQLNDLVIRQATLRDMPEAFVFSSNREIIARGEYSYLFNFEVPSDEQLARARAGDVVLISDVDNNELRALVYLTNFFDAYLYVSRTIEGEVLRLLDETQETVLLYETLERDRDRILFDFALIYLGFALLIIMSSIFLGLWFAERLSRPVGRLALAAENIGQGNLDFRVKEERGGDEIALLSRTFNRMAGQLKDQRDDLIQTNRESEQRRDFIETVLSGVTAGIIGLDGEGRVDLMNRAAAKLLGLKISSADGQSLSEIVPEFTDLLDIAHRAPNHVARGEVRMAVNGEPREFLARIAPKNSAAVDEGYVLSFDDITALASAQRMAAWGDVARRIAHEIKNPLTPIQLSADRMRRKFAARLGEDSESFQQSLDVITRQAGDIRRMVDEFSKFARMPQPVAVPEDLKALLESAVLLQKEGQHEIVYDLFLPDETLTAICDRGLLNQCLTNLLQNAADAIEARRERQEGAHEGRIRVAVTPDKDDVIIRITDNGIGFPNESRDRLTDPYVTTRAKGTGLGLAIVKKIIEQHHGELTLGDPGPDTELDGAEVTLRLPLAPGRGDPNPEIETERDQPQKLGQVG